MDRTELTAFIDESIRSGTYIMVACILDACELPKARSQLRSLVPNQRRRIHFTDESNRERHKVLDQLSIVGPTSHIWTAKNTNPTLGRSAILPALTTHLLNLGVTELVIESGGNQDSKDRKLIAATLRNITPRPSLVYVHAKPHTEPLLWMPDAIAWCQGRDKHWRQQLTRRNLTLYRHKV